MGQERICNIHETMIANISGKVEIIDQKIDHLLAEQHNFMVKQAEINSKVSVIWKAGIFILTAFSGTMIAIVAKGLF
jgi:hypothetical protein